jgi:hypothetical protein
MNCYVFLNASRFLAVEIRGILELMLHAALMSAVSAD